MTISNYDTLLAGAQLNMAQGGSSDSEIYKWAADTVAHPVDALTAVGFDITASLSNLGINITNIGLAASGQSTIHEKVALNMMTSMGFEGAAKYYDSHPDAVQLTGMLAGGWKIGTLGGNALAKYVGRGLLKVNDTGEKITRVVAAQNRLNALAKVALPESDIFKAAGRAYRREVVARGVGIAVAQNTVADIAMSQGAGAEDLTPSDYILGLGLVGAGTYGLSTVANKLTGLKGATQDITSLNDREVFKGLATVPPTLKGNMGETIVLGSKIRDMEATIASNGKSAEEALPPVVIDNLQALVRQHKASIIERLDAVTAPELKVTQGVNNLAAKVSKHLQKAIETDPGKLAGVTRVHTFNSDDFIPGIGIDIWDEAASNLKLTRAALSTIASDLHKLSRNVGPEGVDLVKASKALGVSAKSLGYIQKLNDSVLLDARTGGLFDIAQASNIATIADVGGAASLTYVKGLKSFESSAAQIQRNHLYASGLAHTQANKSMILTKAGIDAMPLEDRLKALAYIGEGKLLNPTYSEPGAATYLNKVHRENTLKEIRYLNQAKGMNSLEISARTHTNWQSVEELLLKKVDTVEGIDSLQSPLFRGNDKGAWDIVKTEKNLVVVRGNSAQAGTRMEIAASLDDKAARSIHAEEVGNLVNSSESQLLGDIYDLSSGGGATAVRAGLESINPALYSSTNRFFTSADHTLRHQKSVADFLHFGGRFKKIVEDKTTAMLQPEAKLLQQIESNDFSRARWNEAASAIRSTKLLAAETEITIKDAQLGIAKIGDEALDTFQPLTNAKGVELGDLPADVIAYWDNYRNGLGKEIFNMQNFLRQLKGKSSLTGTGIHLPPMNLTKQHLAYIPDPNGNSTVLLHSPTRKGLEELILEAKKQYPNRAILDKANDIKNFNIIENHIELGQMRIAEFGKAKTGAVYEEVSAGSSQMADFLAGNKAMLNRLSSHAVKDMNPESLNFLKTMDNLVADEKKTESLYQSLEKTIFGGSELYMHNAWAKSNEWVGYQLSRGIDSIKEAVPIITRSKNPDAEVLRVMEAYKKQGVELPWDNINQAIAQTDSFKALGKSGETAIANLNFLTASFALRFLEGTHALVTMLSIPITTIPEAMGAMEGKGSGMFSAMKFMQEGVKRAYHPAFRKDINRWVDRGIVNAAVSEATDNINSAFLNPSLAAKIQNNPVFAKLSSASDWAESNSRQMAAGTASAIYDSIHGAGSFRTSQGEAFIDIFVKRAMGNYNSTQRPVLFQGPLGSAIGLFQTYIWTMGQNIYRHLEAGRKGTVASLMGTQASVFGLRSLPGYDVINHYVGNHFGNIDNTDITSATYDNIGSDFKAEVALYGAPSALFQQALWTRGVLNANSPLGVHTDQQATGANLDFAGLSVIAKGFKFGKDAYDRISQGADTTDALRAAFQMQTISRPIARLADMFAGSTIDNTGAVIDPDASAKFKLSTIMRGLGSRTMHDQVLRDTMYQGSYYSRSHTEKNKQIYTAARVRLQQGQDVADQFTTYMDTGGSREGWQAMMNTIAVENANGKLATQKETTLSSAIGLI